MKLLQFNRIIESKSIRHRNDIINIIIEACELVILNQFSLFSSQNELSKEPYPFMFIDSMSRLFLFEENKFFSVVFPFQLNLENGQVTFLSQPIEMSHLAIIASVLSDFDERKSIVDLTESILDNDEYKKLPQDEQKTIDELIEYLISYEVGYVRYDYDPDNFSKYSKMGMSNVHPLHHLDINYSSNATYKLGLDTQIDIKIFLDMLDITTGCQFINAK